MLIFLKVMISVPELRCFGTCIETIPSTPTVHVGHQVRHTRLNAGMVQYLFPLISFGALTPHR